MASENKMRWSQLLSHKRLFSIHDYPFEINESGRTQFDADYGRIIFSSQFRRLQDKTQVFPLAKSDYTRTRLTHTMEVASVGMGLGKTLGKLLEKRGELPDHLTPSDIGVLVSVACLAHDIGNPPFGHSGEAAIQEWARRHNESPDNRLKHLNPSQLEDIKRFEGNAQSFRITARLWDRSRKGGGRLTLSTYGGLLKYPQGSNHLLEKNNAARKKFNFTQADNELAIEVCKKLHLKEMEPGRFSRHPIVYLMEAADDICYRIIDIEDSFDAKLISRRRFCQLMQPLQPNKGVTNSIENLMIKDISEIRAHAIGTLMEAVTIEINKRINEIREGNLKLSLIDTIKDNNPDLYSAFEDLSKEAISEVYTDDRVLKIEFAGFKVIGGLLDEFMNALPPEVEFGTHVSLSESGKKLFKLIPTSYLEVRSELYGKFNKINPSDAVQLLTPYERVLVITDYISGMTDTFALELHQILTGIKLP